jgi:hypothetical protein
MADPQLAAARALFEMLVEYYDDSALQPPINVGDPIHTAICKYRKSLPNRSLPPGEARCMRQLLDGSRAEEIGRRRQSQTAAEKWTRLLLKRYLPLRADDPYPQEPGVAPCAASGDYSEPDGPSQWARKFKINPRTFTRYVTAGKIRAKKLSAKSYRVLKSDLPK